MLTFEFIGSKVATSLFNYVLCGTFSKDNTTKVNMLNWASSPSCNHVYCSYCIVLSLNHNSSCSVCQIIVGPREALPIPHMDVLVNIYMMQEQLWFSSNLHQPKNISSLS
jgi:hypothetical protein